FSKTRTGYLVSRITTDEVLVRGLMSTDILAVIRELITLAVGIVLVFWLNWKLAAVAIAIVPFYAVWIVRLNPRVRAQTRQMQEDYSSSAGDMIETLTGIYVVKAFLAEQSELMKMLRSFRKALNAEFHLAMTSNILSIGAAMISSLGKVSLIWFGCWEIMKGQLTIGAFLAFNSFLQYLFEPTQNLLNLNTSAQQSLAAMDRIFELVDERSESRPEVESLELQPVSGAVEFRDVSFAYDGNETVLRNVNLSVDGGSTVAIVGRSGAGKTTLVNLLMRFYDGYNGDILIDGQDIRTVSIESLRSHIGLVPQQPHLFADTVWNNLRYGCPEAGDDRLIECAKRANAHDFIQHLADGYDTKLGERGTTLSGGERQRISIAMAFLKDAPILILDEATSSVDSS
ncbi:MAG: ABC transporter ATP-binding protein, partial [Blastocatellia bacterium]